MTELARVRLHTFKHTHTRTNVCTFIHTHVVTHIHIDPIRLAVADSPHDRDQLEVTSKG